MQVPERLNDIEIYTHHGFFKALQYCDQKYNITNENDFTTCIKAAGTNYREALAQWQSFKYFLFHRAQQGMTQK